jgi:tripartite-type tricarboxylate transporter receptor subunit TctC
MVDRRRLLALAAAAPVLALGRIAAAQAPPLGWPNRFVKLVVPFTPGGGIDGIGRILGARLAEMWGQQVVIENKPGAGGNIASEFVARSAPDGYTIYITAAGLAVNRYLFASINYDPLADFAPVTLICLFPNMLVVPNSSQLHSVTELLALAKMNPGKVTFASPGHGSSPHMSGELFKYLAKVDLTHVPYRGASPAYTDVIAGRVDCTFAVMASALPLVQSGQLRALGVTTAARVAAAPEVPTIAEAGVPGYDTSSWFAFFVPAKTPPEIIRKMHADTVAALAEPQVRAKLDALGSWWWALRPNNSGRILRPRWSGGRPSSRRPTSRSANDHPPPRGFTAR